ncbi:uroporphyrinogen-III synthase [Lentilactobacillus raoultii]|uniref:Uroporphyrinogen-III synthase n=1 Tax=Lentilactobacillus raoultii TaxID=1987503 RepID=A0ABW3PIB7_9LACO|nr:uroporphyrinogen-III synthase [Lentilactobacillus raoultii]
MIQFLITYPKEKIEPALRARLNQVTTPIYCPLRQLRAIALTEYDRWLIRQADSFLITSQFALTVYLKNLRRLNATAGLLVLSQKMATRLKAAGMTNVTVSLAENQRSLVSILQASTNRIVALSGNLKAGSRSLPKSVQRVKVYENTWNEAAQESARQLLVAKQINRILVTSPSSYRRLKKIEFQLPTNFVAPTYYTLGAQTAQLIRRDHRPVKEPDQATNVLAQMILKMCWDEAGIVRS